MDERLEKAFERSRYMGTLRDTKILLKEKAQNQLTYAHNGGQFVITSGFLAFLKAEIDAGNLKTPILDKNDHPIMIEDMLEFYTICRSKYFEVVNDYYLEYEKLKKQRSVEKLLDITNE